MFDTWEVVCNHTSKAIVEESITEYKDALIKLTNLKNALEDTPDLYELGNVKFTVYGAVCIAIKKYELKIVNAEKKLKELCGAGSS